MNTGRNSDGWAGLKQGGWFVLGGCGGSVVCTDVLSNPHFSLFVFL